MSSIPLNLPWHQHDQYTINLFARGGNLPGHVSDGLKQAGMQFLSAGAFAIKTEKNWCEAWNKLHAALVELNAVHLVEVALTPGEVNMHAQPKMDHKQVADIQAIADSMWLGEALTDDRLICYLQPVVHTKDKIFGYESFARVQVADSKEVIAGDAIIEASKALGIEYVVDRMLQVQAIQTFVSSDFNGFLFVNFLPGFIHRPAIYLEGLSETVKTHGVIPKHVVLEFTNSETPRDLTHLKNVCEYGRSRGYSIALDDINTVESARRLVVEIRPDFVKIDMDLAQRTEDKRACDVIRNIVELVHGAGGTVIAEGVENKENHEQLKALGVDLFQGYHFSAPVPVEKALKRNSA